MNVLELGKPPFRPPYVIILFRCMLALMIMAHGWARLLSDAVPPFGEFLEAQGFPFGLWIAWAITVFEIAAVPLFALGRFLPSVAFIFAVIYTAGIILVHAQEGWFVVGLGRNGMEYSVLLITCLLLVALYHLPTRFQQRLGLGGKDTDN